MYGRNGRLEKWFDADAYNYDEKIVVEVEAGREGESLEVEANFDGSHKMTLKTGDRIEIKQSEKKTDIIKLSNVSFLEVLHKKMNEK